MIKRKAVINMDKSEEKNSADLESFLNKANTSDIITEKLKIGNRNAFYSFLNGYIDSKTMQKIHSFWLHLDAEEVEKNANPDSFIKNCIPFSDVKLLSAMQDAVDDILRGSVVLWIDGFDMAFALDLRSFASRGIEEPEKSRTIRGPHEAFNENLVSNLILIRRHLRTSDFHVERFTIGTKVKNDVALLSYGTKFDRAFYDKIKKKLQNTEIPALSMTQETLANLLFPQRGLSVLNPFPRVRYTERPDTATATLLEGKIILLCDNTPSAMILPVTLFDFFEETDDYYFPPLTASYLRIVRTLVFFASVFLVPLWLLLAKNEATLPPGWEFILTDDSYAVPLFLQFLIIEFTLDGLKMASLNTPDTLSNSLSVVGGLLLGDFAVKSGWFVPQTILYSAITAIANFIPNNYELGYSFKFMRLTLILCVEFFGLWGFIIGSLLWLFILISTRAIAGKDYLYPFFPFSITGIKKLILKGTHGKEENI